MSDEVKQNPEVGAGAFIVNQTGKVLLTRGVKWKNVWLIPGGTVQRGETIEQTLVREMQEEVGLHVKEPTQLNFCEFVSSDDFDKKRHKVVINFAVKTDDKEDAVVLDKAEASDYKWVTVDEIIADESVYPTVREAARVYKEKFGGNKEEEYKLGWQRALADYNNLQKETRERRAEWVSMSEQQIIEDFLPVYDNMKKAAASMTVADDGDKRLKSLQQGVGYIMKQFWDVLKNHKVEEIKTVGEMFDARFHETVGEEASDKPSGTIVKEMDGGYTMGGRVIKVAKVIVAQ